eukprot:CAMPEP_0168410962 /NCGR_PEP_ID=MMETSP0228-20121227/27961_1 /TAXON_ID=133427 /ORGANISM="Protoceratium reticulatum, Strain CCCM 535 (=CCMP 1889)" /LENGTH=63 /DNA_ID=CAMNT_0008424705 /DNA_START=23 /DNA_END=211 /DNA_ORIENTATION=-
MTSGALASSVEERGRRMREKALGHEVVGLNSRGNVAHMDAAGDPHQHCLRTLHDLAVHAEEIR